MSSLPPRFWDKVAYDFGCWMWTAAKTSAGYGQFGLNGKTCYSHRLAYEQVCGEIPPGLQLDHLCRNPACCNPFHMEAVTREENVARGKPTPQSLNKQKVFCPQGHQYSSSNTIHESGGRRCKICKNARQIQAYRRKKFLS